MMELTVWLFHGLVIAAVLLAGAAAWELASRWSGRPARWAWLVALAGSVLLPWAVRLLPARGWSEVLPVVLPALVLEAAPVQAGARPAGPGATTVAVLLWAAASLVMLAYVGWLVVRLARARHGWRSAELDGGRVWVTADVGPAAVGLWRGTVVVPAWVLELETDLRSLLLLHEREHVRAGDPRLLLAGLVLVALMPWNPLLWVQFARLRNGIELDCDARVLRAGADPTRYGSLLLEVSRRRGARGLVMATLSEPRLFLEERIRRIARWPLERRPWRAAGFGALALGLFATAMCARDPLRPSAVDALSEPDVGHAVDGTHTRPVAAAVLRAITRAGPQAIATDTPPSAPRQGERLEDGPAFTPMTERPELRNITEVQSALIASYPPLLRDAGIGGIPAVWFLIGDDGVVRQTRISRSSGYSALDSAAVRVGRIMEFTPARNRGDAVPVWVEIPIVFAPRNSRP